MVMKLTDENFAKEVLDAEGLFLVDCYADWCGPCKMMAPVIEELAKEHEGKIKVAKVNIDDSPNVAKMFKVMSIPTFLFIKNGELKDTSVGAVPKAELAKVISELK